VPYLILAVISAATFAVLARELVRRSPGRPVPSRP
jgi:hypothetical protein